MKKFYYLSTVFLTLLLLGATVSTSAQTPQLVQPNSTGIVWVLGTTHNIVWDGDENSQYDIYYTINDAGHTVIQDDQFGNTFSWDIPAIGGSVLPGELYRVVIYAKDDFTTPLFESLNFFEIDDEFPAGSGVIHVNQPDVAGIQWEPGSTYGIYWDDDLVEPVKLELFYWNGSAYVEYTATATGLPTSVEGTGYIWTIPAAFPSSATEYKIKVMSTTTAVFDFGENPFAITNDLSGGTYVDLIQPDDVVGLQWESGTTHLISWMDDLIEPVDIKLYAADGTTLLASLADDVVGTTWDWPIGSLANGHYKIKVVSSVSSINDISTETFAVTDTPSGGTTITLIQPEEAGIQWLFEGTYVISWMDDLIETVNIDLYKNNLYFGTIATNVVGTTYDWTIPAEGVGGLVDATDYKIKIFSSATPPTTSAISTNPFEITATPSGGTYIEVIQPSVTGIEWEIGTDHLISWMDDLIEPVRIKLYNTATSSDVTATNSGIPDVDRTGTTWTWPIPNDKNLEDSGPYKIVITSSASAITDDSEETFAIIDYSPYGEVIMIQPNGGEEWIKGNSYLISWTDNISENVDIYVTDDLTGTPTWHCLTTEFTGVPGSTWTWNTETNWPFGGTITGTDFGVKIRSINTSSTAIGESELPFLFVNTIGGEVWVIQPNGGEVWIDETEYLISWMDELVENVYIKLYDYTIPASPVLIPFGTSGLPDYTDGIGVEGTTHTWDIPVTGGAGLQVGTHYRIRIESIYDYHYADTSEANFEIAAEQTGGTFITVIQPNGGEEWALTTTHLISWNDDVFEDVKIDLYDNQATPVFIKEIADNVEGTTYEWEIDDEEFGVGTYRVRVYSTEDSNLEDYSDAYFTITGIKGSGSNFNFGNNFGELVIYPNPTSTEFTVAAPGSIDRVMVRNLLGQVLYSSNVNAGQTVIDVSNYDAGIYIVNIIVEGEVVTKKLFVQ